MVEVSAVKGRKTSSSKAPSMEEIVEILRNRIVNQELPPGFKLRESALTDEFEVSRPRIREAFGVLEDRGLIERVHNQGAVVARLNPEDVFALYEVREVLEALVVRLATERSDPATWSDLVALFGEPAEQALARGDIDFYVDAVSLFRQRALTAANNAILRAQMESLYDRTKVLIRRLVMVPGRAAEGLRQHQEILQAMSEGNAELAEQLKRANIRSSRESFSNYKKYVL